MIHNVKAIYYSVFKFHKSIIMQFTAVVNTGLDKISFWQ